MHGHLVFSVGRTLLGVSAEHAAEIVALPALTRVPGAPPHIEGVFAHRGEVIPVLDFEKLLALDATESASRVVLLRLPEGSLGLKAVQVFGIFSLEGRMDRLSDGGVRHYLLGPLRAPPGEVVALAARELFEYLMSGGR
jgi:purine-binding chemotaxis protein CheW